jgi:hypothetical protein
METKISKLRFLFETHTIFAYLQRKIKIKGLKKLKKNSSEYFIKQFECYHGYKPNLINPVTFNEKLLWEKLYWRSDLAKRCANKLLVRQVVEERGCAGYLNELYGVFDAVDQISLATLPNSFVIKTTNDSGSVFICKDKNNTQDLKLIFSKVKNSMESGSYSDNGGEWVYSSTTKKIIVEKTIVTSDGHSPKDYKFFCFNGEPKCLFVATNRDADVRFDFFDMDWNHLRVKNIYLNAKETPLKPEHFDEMVAVCKKLSAGFSHVRIDLYDEGGKVIFGEMTFFHQSALSPFYPKLLDNQLGSYFDLELIPNSEKLK